MNTRSLILLVFLIILLSACQKKTAPKGILERSQITILNNEYDQLGRVQKMIAYSEFQTARKGTIISTFSSIDFIKVEMNQINRMAFFDNLKRGLSGDIISMSNDNDVIVLYATDNPEINSVRVIKGISIFSKNANGYWQHKYFSVDEHKVTKHNPNYNAECSHFSSADLTALLYSTFLNESGEVFDADVVLYQINKTFIQTATVPNIQEKKMGKILLAANAPYRATVQNEPNGGMCPTCGDGPGYCECDEIKGIEWCDIKCTSYKLNALADIRGKVRFDILKGDQFRDVVLKQSLLGRKYIEYYYYVSYIADQLDVLTLAAFSDNYLFATACYEVANKLEHGAQSEVPITPQFKTLANNTIDRFESYSSNESYVQVLEDIRADIARYENKTNAEIIVMINE